jgi:hypothetical protein
LTKIGTAARLGGCADPAQTGGLLGDVAQLAAEIAQLCRDMFGPDLASHSQFAATVGLLTQCMRGAALVADLHPKRRPQVVPEWHRQTCLALGVAIHTGAD